MTPPKKPEQYDPDLPPEPLSDDTPPEPAELAGPPEPEDLAVPSETPPPHAPAPVRPVPALAIPPTPASAPVQAAPVAAAPAPVRPFLPPAAPPPAKKKPDVLERQRAALAAEIHNPRGADRRTVLLPLVVLLLLLGGGALLVHVWAGTEDSSRTTRHEVKTAHQELLERERALQEMMPSDAPPVLAELPPEPSASPQPQEEQKTTPAPVTPPTRRAPRVTQLAAPRAPPPDAAEAAPEVVAPARPPLRSLATSMATSFADAAPASSSPASVTRGTFLPACLTAVADPSQAAPFTALVSADVKVGAVVAVPRDSTLVCSGQGVTASRLTGSCDTLTIPGRGSLTFAGLLYGKDKRPGLPVVLSGGPGAGDDARDTALSTAERVLGSVSPGGLGGELLQGAAGAGGRAVRNSARPSEDSAHPVPKGTCFLVFVDQPF